ncbi:hypothetical protein [Erythrobacter aureus]|uniref:hypothetical protein n=1 Tax=Erythrobacter aureus TaxID=2182384 RepID=UPI003A952033
MDEKLDIEVQKNLFAFLPKLKSLLPDHEGHFALLRDQEIASIHTSLSEALKKGYTEFSDGLFSIQKVTDRPVELGMFGHAEAPR